MKTGHISGAPPDDKHLISGCLKNDRASQQALYDRYCRKMYAVCLRYARNTEEAEDLLQEGFIKVYQNLKGFRFASSLGTWMTRIMINTALNAHRSKAFLYPMVDVDERIPDEGNSLAGLAFDQLLEMVRSLPQGCQVVFNLFAVDGYGHREIAEMLGISEGTSKSQYARARSLLQEKLSKEGAMYERYGKK